MNRVTAGSNNGWVEIMGPVSRIAQFKQIETTYGLGDLQQLRWPPSLIADTPAAALARLYMLPGAHYNDPEFSWKYAIPAAPLALFPAGGSALNLKATCLWARRGRSWWAVFCFVQADARSSALCVH